MKAYFARLTGIQIALMALLVLAALAVCLTGNPAFMLIAPVAATVEELAAEMATGIAGVKSIHTDLTKMQGEIKERLERAAAIPTDLKTAIDQALTSYNEKHAALAGTVTELEQRVAAGKANTPEREKSWGEQFIEGAQFKSVLDAGNASSRRGTIAQSVKSVTSTAAGGLIRSAREAEVTALVRERRVMRDLLRTVRVNTSSVDYAVQTTRTNAAAPVAEGTAKPYSDYAWSSATVVVRVLAHLAKITRQAMDDAPRLMDEIDSEMRYGLGYVEERQFLYGSGVGQNLHGIIPQATAFAAAAGITVTLPSKIDVLRLAMLQGAIALLPPTGIVLNDVDWADIELTKTTDGAYLFANPQGTVQPRMWGLPVVNTPAMDVGDFLVGNFQLGATVYDRMDVEVLISTENVDDFEKNLATVRAEERVAIAVKRPEAFVTGDFTTALAAL